MPGPTCFQTLFPLQHEPTVGKAKQTQLILELTILLAQLALTYTSAHIFSCEATLDNTQNVTNSLTFIGIF